MLFSVHSAVAIFYRVEVKGSHNTTGRSVYNRGARVFWHADIAECYTQCGAFVRRRILGITPVGYHAAKLISQCRVIAWILVQEEKTDE